MAEKNIFQALTFKPLDQEFLKSARNIRCLYEQIKPELTKLFEIFFSLKLPSPARCERELHKLPWIISQ